MADATAPPSRAVRGTIAVLADDLIWASRLVTAVERAGARAVRLASETELLAVLEADHHAELGPNELDRRLVGVIIDMNARRYDGPTAVRRAAGAGKPVIAAAQHDDHLTRRRALDAGAQRVFAYTKLFSDGPAVVDRWLTTMSRDAGG
ncbi:MAG TPA: hypothetical protein VGP30_07900 [Candidatus Limnocylindrales bacterium]|nr:hypothetical protein [Candidatus Limnocylindrales bacterium]